MIYIIITYSFTKVKSKSFTYLFRKLVDVGEHSLGHSLLCTATNCWITDHWHLKTTLYIEARLSLSCSCSECVGMHMLRVFGNSLSSRHVLMHRMALKNNSASACGTDVCPFFPSTLIPKHSCLFLH
jgi:hypothetical protein